jgi:hypothetical protein
MRGRCNCPCLRSGRVAGAVPGKPRCQPPAEHFQPSLRMKLPRMRHALDASHSHAAQRLPPCRSHVVPLPLSAHYTAFPHVRATASPAHMQRAAAALRRRPTALLGKNP